MRLEIAQIVHLTDMHLHVDDQGNMKPPQDRSKIVRTILKLARGKWGRHGFQRLAKGLNAHSIPALRALISTLDTVVRGGGGGKLIIVQSGDLEAYGPTPTVPAGWSFPALNYWKKECNRLPSKVDLFLDVYGNHDVWPGTLPLLAPLRITGAENSLRARAEFSTLMPDRVILQSPPYRLELYRLNTVQSGCLRNTFSEGQIAPDCLLGLRFPTYPISGGTDPVAELCALGQQSSPTSSDNVIRLLAMHHPPHFFAATGTPSDLMEGPLTNARVLLPALHTFRFHLVIAGHRHALNPAPGTTLSPVAWGQPQTPLPYNTVQFVAGSPTQAVGPGDDRPSFSLYALYAEANRGTLFVERTVYRFKSDLDQSFTPDPVERLVNDLLIN